MSASDWYNLCCFKKQCMGNLSEEEIIDLDLKGKVFQTFENTVQAEANQQKLVTFEKSELR